MGTISRAFAHERIDDLSPPHHRRRTDDQTEDLAGHLHQRVAAEVRTGRGGMVGCATTVGIDGRCSGNSCDAPGAMMSTVSSAMPGVSDGLQRCATAKSVCGRLFA